MVMISSFSNFTMVLNCCSCIFSSMRLIWYLYSFHLWLPLLHDNWILLIHIYNSIAEKFPYLVQKKLKKGQEIRRVAQMDWKIIGDDCNQPFYASGLKFIPLPVNDHRLCHYCKNSVLLYHKDFAILNVGYAWRGLHLFGLSFWWE